MIIETRSGLIYDSTDDRCYFETQVISSLLVIGFVQSYDKKTGHKSRSCGVYDKNKATLSIEKIMSEGYTFDRLIENWSAEIESSKTKKTA